MNAADPGEGRSAPGFPAARWTKDESIAPIEKMEGFFDVRAVGYDEHMRTHIEDCTGFYRAVAEALPISEEPVAVLDLGIGTGLQLPGLFERVPRARVTGIDLSSRMLAELRRKFAHRIDQLRLIRGSFLDLDFGRGIFEAVQSVMALHHHPFDEKVVLYRKVRESLAPGGIFVNGDYVVEAEEAADLLAQYEGAIRALGSELRDPVHLDIPFTEEREREALREAGFASVDVPYRRDRTAVFVAR